MPTYEYHCICGAQAFLRRPVAEMDDETVSLCCGRAMQRVFTTTANLFVPRHFRYSWSDFHDVSERELAHLTDEDGNKVEVEHAGVAISQSGGPSRTKRRKRHASD